MRCGIYEIECELGDLSNACCEYTRKCCWYCEDQSICLILGGRITWEIYKLNPLGEWNVIALINTMDRALEFLEIISEDGEVFNLSPVQVDEDFL